MAALALVAIPSVARADEIQQDTQVVFGTWGTYVPAQNNLADNVLAIGQFLAVTHTIDWFHAGLRVAVSADTGFHQVLVDPSAFLGAHVRAGRVMLRLDAGLGPLADFGDFAPVVIAHAYGRVAIQLRIGSAFVIEALGGPGFLIGPNVVGLMGEAGVGAGWNF